MLLSLGTGNDIDRLPAFLHPFDPTESPENCEWKSLHCGNESGDAPGPLRITWGSLDAAARWRTYVWWAVRAPLRFANPDTLHPAAPVQSNCPGVHHRNSLGGWR